MARLARMIGHIVGRCWAHNPGSSIVRPLRRVLGRDSSQNVANEGSLLVELVLVAG